MLEHRGSVWRHAPAALGTALLVVAAVVGTQVALAAAGSPRAPLSPYGEGGFTVGVAAVDKRISITSADDGSYVLGYTPPAVTWCSTSTSSPVTGPSRGGSTRPPGGR